MDDAGDGRRGARATVSQGPWEVLAARYRGRKDATWGEPEPESAGQPRRRSAGRAGAPAVGEPARRAAIQRVRRWLDGAGVPCRALVPAHDGASWAGAGGRLVEVERFIPHDRRMNTPRRLAIRLPILGRIQRPAR